MRFRKGAWGGPPAGQGLAIVSFTFSRKDFFPLLPPAGRILKRCIISEMKRTLLILSSIL